MKRIKGFKAFSPDMICRDMQYEIGQEYKMNDTPIPCQKGYHFCKSIADCYSFYPMDNETVICEIEALGEVATDDDVKFCTNHIKIVRKVAKPREKSNKSPSCSGFCNSGNCNSGNRNSGNCNSGNRNSGDWNSGDWNSGNCNSGNWNSGDCNSGDCNSGDWNSGNCNSGNRNSGDWNSGDWNSGVFNTNERPTIKMFDKESNWTYSDWHRSRAYDVMYDCPCTHSEYIYEYNMSEEEKENHPEYKTIGGYIKTFVVTNKDKQDWWDNLPSEDKQSVYELPNFDPVKFKECTGIDCGLEET